jgi:NitT/TauT family transport system ATP-binding protein
MVFQDYALLPWADALTNVAFGLKLRGMGKEQRLARAQELLELVGLEGFEHSLPKQLSGGMQQRIGLARALAVEPQILLMDEPFGSLDEISRRGMQVELLRIWEQHKKTAVFVTHSVDEAVFLSDRVVVMTARPGRIAAVLSVDLPRPRSRDMEESAPFGDIRAAVWRALGT